MQHHEKIPAPTPTGLDDLTSTHPESLLHQNAYQLNSGKMHDLPTSFLEALLPDHPADQVRGCHVDAGDVT
ncbi:hypothetical protein ACWGVR_40520 [Streptomyces xanthophaeus]